MAGVEDDCDTWSLTSATQEIVQRLLQDIVLTQKAVLQRLSDDAVNQELSIRESFVSRDQYENDLKKLETTLKDEYVPKGDYDEVVALLEKERLAHAQTRSELNDVTDRLEFALGEIEVLTKQLDREKATFEKAFGTLRNKALKETSKTIQLENKCTEIEKQCEKKEDILNSKTEEIKTLEKKLKEKEILYKKKVTEAEIQRKQEQYIAKLLEEQDKKKSRNRGSNSWNEKR